MQLELTNFFDQKEDITYEGKSLPKTAFRCARVSDKEHPCHGSDRQPTFAEHISTNVAPVVHKGLEGSNFAIYGMDVESDDVDPHLILSRNDFAALTDDDCNGLKKLLAEIVDKYNKLNTPCKASPKLFTPAPVAAAPAPEQTPAPAAETPAPAKNDNPVTTPAVETPAATGTDNAAPSSAPTMKL